MQLPSLSWNGAGIARPRVPASSLYDRPHVLYRVRKVPIAHRTLSTELNCIAHATYWHPRYNRGTCEMATNCVLRGAPLQCDKVGDLMANNLLMLIKLDTDTMVFMSLLVSIVGALAAIFAAFYANIAAFYAKKAATKRASPDTGGAEHAASCEHFSNKILSIDTQVPQPQAQGEAITGSTSAGSPTASASTGGLTGSTSAAGSPTASGSGETLQAQPQQEAPQVQVQRISISVEGEAMGEVPLELCLTLQDSSIRVSRVETLNEVGKTLSSSPSKATDNALVFKSILTPKKVRQWWSAGESTSEGGGRSVLRVYLLVDESRREVYRDIPVSIVEELRSVGIASMVVWTIKGSI